MKIFKIVAVLLVALFLFLELIIFNSDANEGSTKPIVSVSTFSLYDLIKHIAGDSIEVVNILPFGVDPHSFELTPKIMAKIENSTLVFYSGAGLEPWIDKIHFKAKQVDMSQYVKLHEFNEGEHKHHDEHYLHSKVDPHYWLNFSNMVKLAKIITLELETIMPQNANLYQKNRDTYIQMLMKLDEEYTERLKECRIKTVIINHNSLSYLAGNYNFHAESLSGLSPEEEPSPSDIKRILNEIKEDGVSTIFYENFVNSKVMKSISKDSNIVAEVFFPLGNITADQADVNASYETLMRQNLEKLTKAMHCR